MSTNTPTTVSPKTLVAVATAWSGINQAIQALIGVASVFLLSQWLAPVDYGRFAMAAAVTSFLGVLGDSGVVAALTRRSELDRTALATGFWLALAGGSVLSALSAVAAPLIAMWYGARDIGVMAAVLAMNFLVAVPSRVPTAKLMREMRFRVLAIVNAAAGIISLVVALALARRGAGAWSLVAQFLSAFAMQGFLGMLATRVSIRWSAFSPKVARELGRIGLGVGGYSFAVTTARCLDPLFAGRYLGAGLFGLVGMGSRMVTTPTIRAAASLSHVFLPTLASLPDVRQRAFAFARALRLVVLVVLPLPVGMATVAPELVALLPDGWKGLQGLLPLLSVIAALEPLNLLSVAVVTSQERGGALGRLGALLVPVGWTTGLLGALSGSASGYVLWTGAWAMAHSVGLGWIASRSVGLSLRNWRDAIRAATPAVAMVGVVRATLWAANISGTREGLVFGVCAGIIAYVALAWTLTRETARDARVFLRALFRSS